MLDKIRQNWWQVLKDQIQYYSTTVHMIHTFTQNTLHSANCTAFTKSLVSVRSRNISFTSLLPWSHTQILSQTQSRSQTQTQPRNEAYLSPV